MKKFIYLFFLLGMVFLTGGCQKEQEGETEEKNLFLYTW